MSGNGRAKESTLFEMYRYDNMKMMVLFCFSILSFYSDVREVELLDALEGVVRDAIR